MSILLKRGVSLEQSKEPALSRPCHVYTENVVISRNIQPAQSMDELSPQQILELCRTAQVKDELDGVLLADKLEQAAKDSCLELVADALDDEPYVSSRVNHLIHQPELVASGLMLAGRAIGVEKLSAAVFWNIMNLETRLPKELTFPDGSKGVIYRTGGRYPQGLPRRYRAARQKKCYLGTGALIHLHRAVFEGRVQNTVFLTVGGNCVRNSLNMEIPLGMPISRVLDYAGLLDEPNTVVAGGGSMTGAVLENPEKAYVQPDTRAVLAFRQRPVSANLQCIGCGRCIDACPQSLPVYYIYRAAQQKLYSEFETFEYERCIECGCCSHVCPAKLNVMEEMRQMKQTFRRREEKDLELLRKIDIGMGPLEDDEPQAPPEPSLAAVQLKKLARSIEQSLSGHGEQPSDGEQPIPAPEQAGSAPEQAQNRRKKKKNRKKSGQNQPINATVSGASGTPAQPAAPGPESESRPEQQSPLSSGTSRLPESGEPAGTLSASQEPRETEQAALQEVPPETAAELSAGSEIVDSLAKTSEPAGEEEKAASAQEELSAKPEASLEAPSGSTREGEEAASPEATSGFAENPVKAAAPERAENETEIKLPSPNHGDSSAASESPESAAETESAVPSGSTREGEEAALPEATSGFAENSEEAAAPERAENETEIKLPSPNHGDSSTAPESSESAAETESAVLSQDEGDTAGREEQVVASPQNEEEPAPEESPESIPEPESAVPSRKEADTAGREEQTAASPQNEEEPAPEESPESTPEPESAVPSPKKAEAGETEKIVDSLKALEQQAGKPAVHVTVKPHSGPGGHPRRSGGKKGGKKQ